MRILILLFVVLISTSCGLTRLAPSESVQKLGEDPYMEVDGIPIQKKDLNKYNPEKIAVVNTLYSKEAKKRFGQKAKDGAVLIFTKEFAIEKYENLFRKVSEEYSSMRKGMDPNQIQYILNNRVLKANYEGDLAVLSKKQIRSIRIINKNELIETFQIRGKSVGVIIEAKRPKNVYNSKEKY